MTESLNIPEGFDSRLEVRDLERREVFGRIVPYGERILVRGRPESFALGALADIAAPNVRLFDHHERAVGRAVSIEERADGAYAAFRVSKTARGDELLELAADGVLSFSPGFVAGVQTRDGVHTKVRALPEVSLVSLPAYSQAQVLAVREHERNDSMSEETTPTPEPQAPATEPAPAVDLAPIETRMDDLAGRLDRLQSSVDAPPAPHLPQGGPDPRFWLAAQLGDALNIRALEPFARQWADGWAAYEKRALDDVTGTLLDPSGVETDASGLVPEVYLASQVVNVVDNRRPLFRRLGSFPMPRSGYARIPVVTQHTEVGPRGAQKSEVPSRSLIVQTKSFEAAWLAGAVDVALELIRTADINVLDFIWNDLLGQYGIQSEAALIALVDAGLAGATYSGTALDTATYAGFAEDVATAASVVRTQSGAPADSLAVTTAQWIDLVSMVDAGGRRIFAPIGQENSDGSVSFTADSFTLVGGIEVFEAPGLDAAMLFNGESLRIADGGPERVEAVNVAEMGVDIGLLGRTMFVPRIPAGVYIFGVEPS